MLFDFDCFEVYHNKEGEETEKDLFKISFFEFIKNYRDGVFTREGESYDVISFDHSKEKVRIHLNNIQYTQNVENNAKSLQILEVFRSLGDIRSCIDVFEIVFPSLTFKFKGKDVEISFEKSDYTYLYTFMDNNVQLERKFINYKTYSLRKRFWGLFNAICLF